MAETPGINFRKIIENVISYLVTSVFIGACVIVWRGATTVDERVGKTEKNLQVLIDNLSAKLTIYEVQLEAQSNQLAAVYTELKNLKPLAQSRHTNGVVNEHWMMRQQDISQQLQMKK